MIGVLLFLVFVALASFAVVWLIDHPGTVEIVWLGQNLNLPIGWAFAALLIVIVVVLIAAWLLSSLWHAPGSLSRGWRRRRQRKSLDAVRRGLLAVGAGDVRHAKDASTRAQRLVPDEPLTLLLKAQTAQLTSDGEAASSAYRTMLEKPETRTLGLRGLYGEALRHGDRNMAERFAIEASKIEPNLPWAGRAVYEAQCRNGAWDDALETLTRLSSAHIIDRETARRHRAALLTAEALRLEGTEPEEAQSLASEAHKLAPDLIPAALVTARQMSRTGDVRGAAKVIERTWVKEPHYALAEVYAHARAGDSAQDRLTRVRSLTDMMGSSEESHVALARAAIDAKDWKAARDALKPAVNGTPSRRDCMLMAHIEEMENGDTGAAREWLSRALSARPDPAWVAGDVVSETWAPISPITGDVDAFRWRRPPENTEGMLLGGGDPTDAFIALTAARKPDATDTTATNGVIEDAIVEDSAPSGGSPRRGGEQVGAASTRLETTGQTSPVPSVSDKEAIKPVRAE